MGRAFSNPSILYIALYVLTFLFMYSTVMLVLVESAQGQNISVWKAKDLWESVCKQDFHSTLCSPPLVMQKCAKVLVRSLLEWMKHDHSSSQPLSTLWRILLLVMLLISHFITRPPPSRAIRLMFSINLEYIMAIKWKVFYFPLYFHLLNGCHHHHRRSQQQTLCHLLLTIQTA